jgi:hypothetical protein
MGMQFCICVAIRLIKPENSSQCRTGQHQSVARSSTHGKELQTRNRVRLHSAGKLAACARIISSDTTMFANPSASGSEISPRPVPHESSVLSLSSYHASLYHSSLFILYLHTDPAASLLKKPAHQSLFDTLSCISILANQRQHRLSSR